MGRNIVLMDLTSIMAPYCCRNSVPKISLDDRLLVMWMLIFSFCIGYGNGSSTVMFAWKHPNVDLFVLCTSVTLTGLAIGNFLFKF